MANASFEDNKSSWSLELTADEINRVRAMTAAISARKDGREFVWVRRTGPSTRRWFVQGYNIQAYFDAAATQADPTEAVVIPAHALELASDLADVNGEVTMFLNEKENIVVCRALDQYAAVDGYDPEESEPTFDPVADVDSVFGGKYMRRVKVAADVLERIAGDYMTLRRRSSDGDSVPLPPVTTLAFTPDSIRWTSDWSRIGKPAVSGMAPAVTDRYFDITFYPLYFWTYIDICPLDTEVTFGYDDTHVAFWGDNWAVWGKAVSELYVRWADRADDVFGEFGFSRDEDSFGMHELDYTNDDVSINVDVIEGVAGPDCIRLTCLVDSGVEVTKELLAETLALSDTLVGAKLGINENYLAITVDIDNPRNSDHFKDGITAMLAAIGRCGDFAKVLPLFSNVIPAPDGADDLTEE